eukprot:7262967-Prymnesium_polylepis.1
MVSNVAMMITTAVINSARVPSRSLWTPVDFKRSPNLVRRRRTLCVGASLYRSSTLVYFATGLLTPSFGDWVYLEREMEAGVAGGRRAERWQELHTALRCARRQRRRRT